MDKATLVDYLANLIVIDDYLDDRGVQNDWLNREEKERFEELQKIVEEEQKKADEAGKSKQQHIGPQERANSESSLTRRG